MKDTTLRSRTVAIQLHNLYYIPVCTPTQTLDSLLSHLYTYLSQYIQWDLRTGYAFHEYLLYYAKHPVPNSCVM